MNTTPQDQQTGPGIRPDEARAALEQASRTSPVAPRDRTIYAVGTALFGDVGKRPRTWLSLTAAGRAAYERHLAALRAIADGRV